ncbi:M23 family metallopeptidase [Alkalilacustris brevis]|uniref:M23 family metallopeptidase n=1 Tax=Alkalilacustris brevis TaxID=2026338 RepID=UPI000E0D78D3|nr:M23 family metallopeptidase [Alkalilacustris brevis]
MRAMSKITGRRTRPLVLCASILALAACDNGFDWDLRPSGNGTSTTEAARQATAQRPQPDARGVISYPNYQVVVARGNESVAQVAQRLDLSPQELAQFNALSTDTQLRPGEVLALPSRVAAGPAGTADGRDGIDVAAIATTAIDRADQRGDGPRAPVQVAAGTGQEPVRHRVVRGETAYSIARLYNVSTRSLADWNGLGPDLEVREGQYLIIPVPAPGERTAAAAPSEAPRPGSGSPTPEPPSAAQPLPQDDPAAAPPPAPPPSPNLAAERSPEPEPEAAPAQATAATDARLIYPVEGRIIRGYNPGSNDGISIAASAGTAVRAADSGTVAAITRDTDQMPILVIRHADNLLTVYANIDDIRVERGATVQRGDTIAVVRSSDPAFVHFEVRQGFDSVDPMDYLP